MQGKLILIYISHNDKNEYKNVLQEKGRAPTEMIRVLGGKELVSTLAYAVGHYQNILITGAVSGTMQSTVNLVSKAIGARLKDVSDKETSSDSNEVTRIPEMADIVTVGDLNCGCRIEKSGQVIAIIPNDRYIIKNIMEWTYQTNFFLGMKATEKEVATGERAMALITEYGEPASYQQMPYGYGGGTFYEEDVEEEEEVGRPRLIKPIGKSDAEAINLDELFGEEKPVIKVEKKHKSSVLVVSVVLLAVLGILFFAYVKWGSAMVSDFVFARVKTLYEQNIGDPQEGEVLPEFEALQSKNENVGGWLKIKDTNIDFPVMTSNVRGEGYYQNNTFFKFKNKYGTPYMSENVVLGVKNQNTTIYGSNVDKVRVFAELSNYANLDYYKAHPIIHFDTLYAEGKYKIFAVLLIDDKEPENIDYRNNMFENDDVFQTFLTRLQEDSKIKTTVEPAMDDQILTLTTQLGNFDGARIVICAKKISEGEKETVDTDHAQLSLTARIPARFSGEETDVTVKTEPAIESTASDESTTGSSTETTIGLTTRNTVLATTIGEKGGATETVTSSSNVAGKFEGSQTTAATQVTITTKAQTTTAKSNNTTKAQTTAKTAQLTTKDSSKSSGEKIRFSCNGTIYYEDRVTVVARIIQAEMGDDYSMEALKAQAVVAYSFIKAKQKGNPDAVITDMAYSTAAMQSKCLEAAKAVDGIAVTLRGSYIPLYCFDTSAGKTAWSKDVWGGDNYSYTSSVDSNVDTAAKYFEVAKSFSSAEVAKYVKDYTGIDLTTIKDKNSWIKITKRDANNLYINEISLGGKKNVSGQHFRYYIMKLSIRSHCFTVKYNSSDDTFTFVTKGYGHGVGMSQTGANQYAKQGKSYQWILDHYYNLSSSGAKYSKTA